jgi:signal transduction histidine kinase
VSAQAPERPAPVLVRLRSSVLGKVLGALVVVLVVSTAVTALVDARLTHNAVAKQTRQVATSNLTVLQEAFADRQRTLAVNTQTIADGLARDALTDPARRAQLYARLGAEAQNHQLDLLDVVDSDGRPLDPPISVGTLQATTPLGSDRPFTTEPTSRLVMTRQGRYVQAVPVQIGTALRPLVLLGGLEFGDDHAFSLRRQVGGLADVILVAGGRVAGSTFSEPLREPPAWGDGERPPTEPRMARLEGVANLVAYRPVGRSAQDPVGGALGIALPDPAVPLDRALGSRRLIAGLLLAVLAVALGWLLFRVLTQPLVNLARTAVRIAGGELERPFVASGSDEIASLARALEHMRQELRSKLEVVENQAAELRESSQRIVAAQDEERRRLARDLHDGIQQQLVVLRLRVGLAQEAAGGPGAQPGLLAELGSELDSTISQLREVSHDLYPAILRDRGLAAAVRSYAGRMPVTSTLAVTPDPLPRLPADVESAAYFLLCEAATNTLKHSGATEVAVSLGVEDGQLRVRLADNGKGFAAAAGGRRSGLQHMEDRVRSFGGTLEIASEPGAGCSVTASFPLATEAEGDAGFRRPDGAAADGASPVPAGVASVTPSGAAERTGPPPPGGSYPAPR